MSSVPSKSEPHAAPEAPVKAKSALAQQAVTDGAEWLTLVSTGRAQADVALLAKAAGLIEAQTLPSVHAGHAFRVGQIVHDLQMDASSVAAAAVTTAQRYANFEADAVAASCGEDVATLVGAVERLRTVPDLLSGPRDQEQLDRLRRLFLTLVNDVRAALISLAERLHAMRELVTVECDGNTEKTAQLTLDIYAPLASRLGVWQVKWELEDLAFRTLYPGVYKDIAKQLSERRADRERYVDDVVSRVQVELDRAGISARVVGRPKHIYSIWRKMQAKSLRFNDLFDVRAVRVVTDTVASCYAALGIVHGLWAHVPNEFDDYIANPKANRYQSLHTAVIGPQNRTVEIQIRTEEMNTHAELGVAAHWRYKEGDAGSAVADDRLAWLRQALEWRDQIADGELWQQLRSGLDDERVYALTPQGRVIELPRGATPVDFAYRVHTDVGHRCRGARVDGHIVSITTPLRSGNTVEILTSARAGPSRDWLNRELGYLVTSRARAKVRQWFRQLDYEQNVADGRETWEREVRRLRLPGTDLEGLAERFNFTKTQDLLAAIGRGEVQIGHVARTVQDALGVARRPTVAQHAPRQQSQHDFSVEGVGELLVQVARCCTPVPPEPIMGYITRGRGVTVHRDNCTNILRLMGKEADRVIEVQWGEGTQKHTVELLIKAYDRRGLLRDVSAVVANSGMDVRGLESRTDEKSHVVSMKIWVDVSDAGELSQVIGRVLQVRNVFEALRQG